MSRNLSGLVILSLLSAFLLQVYPLSGQWMYWRPSFVLLVVLFWLIHDPFRFGIGFAWLCGFGVDVVFGGLFGTHALAFGICAYMLQLSTQRIQHFQVWHQAIMILLMVIVSQLVVLSINLLVREGTSKAIIFYPAIASAILWIPLSLFLNRICRPFSVK